jgi:hypothetical protein
MYIDNALSVRALQEMMSADNTESSVRLMILYSFTMFIYCLATTATEKCIGKWRTQNTALRSRRSVEACTEWNGQCNTQMFVDQIGFISSFSPVFRLAHRTTSLHSMSAFKKRMKVAYLIITTLYVEL